MKDILLKIGSALKEHFTELLLCVMFLVVCGFVMVMSHVHNDSLASKMTEYAGQILGALFLAMKSLRSSGGGQGNG